MTKCTTNHRARKFSNIPWHSSCILSPTVPWTPILMIYKAFMDRCFSLRGKIIYKPNAIQNQSLGQGQVRWGQMGRQCRNNLTVATSFFTWWRNPASLKLARAVLKVLCIALLLRKDVIRSMCGKVVGKTEFTSLYFKLLVLPLIDLVILHTL